MQYNSLQQALSAMEKYERTKAAYDHAMGVLYLDATTVAPSDSWEGRSKTMEVLSELVYRLETDPELESWLTFLESHKAELDPVQVRKTELIRKNYDRMHRIPAQEYVDFTVLLNEAQMVWQNAKAESDFDAFAPYLEKIVDYNRRFAAYYDPNLSAYDALLNEYEEGLNMAVLDVFFSKLRKSIVPLVEKIRKAEPVDDGFLYRSYPIDKQRIFTDYLMEVMGMDRRYSTVAETEHPYTTNFNNKDVRITTHYYENNLASSMFSVIHEGGHALYELGADDSYNQTVLSGGVSMGIHESQSRFYENIIGRSEAFVHAIFPKLKELFPEQLADVDEEKFYRAINKVSVQPIRIEADELSYCLHVMVRYEIEKQLIDGSLKVSQVPERWNELYREYLGIEIQNDREGCLQDSHWSGGSIGYFPSYALGSAYGPQLLDKMEKEHPDIWKDVADSRLESVTGWLRENIHRHASFVKAQELFERVCGEFDVSYYINYLEQKFRKIYGI